jgi:uncharacterized protein (DUF58 family)
VSNKGKLSVTAVITIGLIVVGIIVRDGRMLALAFPFLLYTAALFFLQSPTQHSLEITRRLDIERLEEGEVIHVVLTMVNRGEPIPRFGLAERIPEGVEVIDGETRSLCSLGEGGRVVLSYTLRPPRGVYTLPGLEITTWKRLALAPQSTFLAHEDRFIVLPRVEVLEEIEIRPRRTRAYAGIVRANRGGSGLDFFGCRSYSSGDDIRRINWRTYAKRGELVIDEYEQERIADVSILLDARELAHTRVGEEETFTYAVRAAASMASHFLSQGNSVSLLIYGDYLNWTYPGYGKVQRERILDALARAKTGTKEVFEDLRFVPTRLFPPQSQIILISPLYGEDDVEVLGILRTRGYQIILIVPNLLPLELRSSTPSEDLDLARRIIQCRRTLLLTTLTRIGVEVIDWDVAEPLSYPVGWGLSRRGRRFR